MNRIGVVLATAVFAVGPVPAGFGDIVFQAWVDAPEVAVAGSVFTVSVWIEATGSAIDNDVNAMASFTIDVVASGLRADLSEATMLVPGFSDGTPAANALREVSGFNHPAISPFSVANPLELFTTEVTLEPNATGVLELGLAQTDGWDFMFSWWVDYHLGTHIFDSDPGSTRIVTPATVHVIPAPASIAVLGMGALAARRRRH